MASSFLIVMSIWFSINILFVAIRLWVTRQEDWHVHPCPRRLSAACVKSRLHHV